MKRIFLKSWIFILSLAALLVGSCSESKKMSKNEKKKDLQTKIDSLNQVLKMREGACVYGPPELIAKYGEETDRIRMERDSLQKSYDDLNKK